MTDRAAWAMLLPAVTVSGGVRRIVEISNHLTRRGHDVTIFHPSGEPCDWLPCAAQFEPEDALRGRAFDVVLFVHTSERHRRLVMDVKSGRRVLYLLGLNPDRVVDAMADDERTTVFQRLVQGDEVTDKWVVSSWMAEWVRDNLAAATEVVIGGVDHALFRPRRGLRDADRPLVLHSGDVRKRKASGVAAQAVEAAVQARPELRGGTIWGAGLAQEEIAMLYASASVFVSAEIGFGWSNTVVEAMACGTPVCCCEQGGVRDFAFHGETALLSPPGDVETLAANIVRLLDEPEMAKRQARQAFDHVAQYTWEATTDRVEALLSGRAAPLPTDGGAVNAAMLIPGKSTADELLFLYRCAKKAPPGIAVDLGTFQGRSAALLALADRDVITIDNYREGRTALRPEDGGQPDPEVVAARLDGLGRGGQVVTVTGDTSQVPGIVASRPALIFFDGEHVARQLEADMDAWLPLLQPGGIAVFHDYGATHWPDVREVVDRRLHDWKGLGGVRSIVAFRKPGGVT